MRELLDRLSSPSTGPLLREATYEPNRRYSPHRDQHPRISILLTGSLREGAEGRVEHGRSGSVVIKSASVRHEDHFGPEGARMLSLLHPTTLFETCGDPDAHTRCT